MDDHLSAEICLRDAWPSPEIVDCSGWQLRAGRGGYNRVNSVWTGRFGGDLAAAIDKAEAFYRAHGLGPRFQILDIAQPAGLDAELARRGYRRELDCSDMAKTVAAPEMPADVSVTAETTADWLALYNADLPPERMAELADILANLPAERGFILCRRNGSPAGVALVSRVGEDAAVDCVLTAPAFRRTGVARSLMTGAEAWAAERGVRRLLLSVLDENVGAVALYSSLGYRRLAAYHYRVAGT